MYLGPRLGFSRGDINFWLFFLFRTQEKNNLSKIKSELDSRKERKRNLVPAKTGVIILILSLFYSIIFGVGYKAFDNSGTRNYFLSLFQDFHTCIVAPGILVFQAPSIQRKINKTLKTSITIDKKVDNSQKLKFLPYNLYF